MRFDSSKSYDAPDCRQCSYSYHHDSCRSAYEKIPALLFTDLIMTCIEFCNMKSQATMKSAVQITLMCSFEIAIK